METFVLYLANIGNDGPIKNQCWANLWTNVCRAHSACLFRSDTVNLLISSGLWNFVTRGSTVKREYDFNYQIRIPHIFLCGNWLATEGVSMGIVFPEVRSTSFRCIAFRGECHLDHQGLTRNKLDHGIYPVNCGRPILLTLFSCSPHPVRCPFIWDDSLVTCLHDSSHHTKSGK